MWLARYIVSRVAEKFGCDSNFEPKPVKGIFSNKGDWNGFGCHTYFSFNKTRE
jgi:glutamine synthetase